MDELTEIITPLSPGYDRTFSIIEAKGTWRPFENSHPFDGEPGKISYGDELIIGFSVYKEELEKVLIKIKEVHPYEEPWIDVIPALHWKDLIHSS